MCIRDRDQPIEHKMLTNAIENAQKRIEGKNFQIRKNVLQYDDVMNLQREVIYSQRQKVLNGETVRDNIQTMLEEMIDSTIAVSYTHLNPMRLSGCHTSIPGSN